MRLAGEAPERVEVHVRRDPEELVDEHSDELPGLQYALHSGAELAVGIDAPATAQPLHAELVAALSEARDATAAISFGGSKIG